MNENISELTHQVPDNVSMSDEGIRGQEKNKINPGMLYLVATPVGNLSDISERAVKVLSGVDFIAAEDTRNSMRLLHHLNIHKNMISVSYTHLTLPTILRV